MKKKKCVICNNPVRWPNLKYCWDMGCYKEARRRANVKRSKNNKKNNK